MENVEFWKDPVSTLADVSSSISSHQELHTTLSIISEKAAKATGSQVVLVEVSLANPLAKPQIYGWYGITSQETKLVSDFLPLCKKAYTEKKGLFIEDYYLETEGAVPSFVRVKRLESVTIFPLIVGERMVGALYCFRSKKIPLTRQAKNLVLLLATQAAIAIQQAELLLERHAGYVRTIRILADIIDRKDSYTHGHSSRVMELALMIADRIGIKGRERQNVGDGGYLHDLGKINVDLSILQKPGKLTPQEWERMIIHPDVGAEIVCETGVLQGLAPVIRHHHEMYAGGGYPDGLAGEQIPLGSRIVAVADAYEAMISDRPYRKGMSHEAAIQELRRHSGTQFDPGMIQAFVEVISS